MSEAAYGITTFCEDIRDEKDGQFTFVGVYRGKMQVTELPTTLPKLAFHISFVVPRSETIGVIKTYIYLPGDDLGRPTYVSEADVGSVAHQLPKPDTRPQFVDPDVVLPHKLDQSLVFSPATINAEGFIKVRIQVGEHFIKAGTLKVERVDPSPDLEDRIIPVSLTFNAP